MLEGRVRLLAGVGLGGLTAALAEAHGDHPALVADEPTPGLPPRRTRSFADVEHDVSRLAAAHLALDHAAERRVAVAIDNRVDVVLHVLALARAGAVPVPVSPRLEPAELRAVLEEARVSAVVADGPLGEGARGLDVRWCWTGAGDHPDAGADLAVWLAAHPGARLVEGAPRPDPDAPAVLLATSGTTGRPKLARLTSQGLLGILRYAAAVPLGNARGPRAGRDALLCVLPLVHVMGLSAVLGGLCAGVRTIHLARFDPDRVLGAIERERPNAYVGVPTMYADLEAHGAAERDLSSVQLFVSAADVMPPDRARRFQRYGALGHVFGRRVGTAAFADVYGMVELSGGAAVRLYPPSLARGLELPPVAITFPGFEPRAVDEAGAPVGWGTPGRLQIRGKAVLRGYEGRGSALDREGWFTTGDLARVWPGGLLTFVGRSKDRLKVGGFSVFPAEVEEILRTHPAVREVVVVGVPDERLGERPVALVVPRGEGLDTEAFLAWTKGRVAGYRRPREALVVDHVPRGNHGKLDREAATRMAVEQLEA